MRPLLLILAVALIAPAVQAESRLIEITADHDSRFKVAGHANPTLTLRAGEPVTLRITAVKAKTMNRDGSIHGFVLMDKDGEKVDGWILELWPGTHDFNLIAPSIPGEYQVVCNVICSNDHEFMRMKIRVIADHANSASAK